MDSTGDAGLTPVEPIKTYSLEEVAAMVLPSEWDDGTRWLKRRLSAGEVGGYRLSRSVWRMTHADVEELIERRRNRRVSPPPVPPQPQGEHDAPAPPHGLTERSWALRQRAQIPGTLAYYRLHPEKRPKPQPPRPPGELPSWFQMVHPESAEAIAKMAPLSATQQALLDRVRREGVVTVSGVGVKKTVDSLVRRNLVSYTVTHELHENSVSYRYRFTLRLPGDGPTPSAPTPAPSG